MFTKRSKEKELMDLGHDYYTPEEYADCLSKLFKVNKLLGFFRHTVKLLQRFPQDIVLADMGCGGGLFLLNLNRYYPAMQMLGIDISAEAIRLAQNELTHWQKNNLSVNVEFHLQNQAEIELKKNAVDIVMATLVCHHLDDDELIVFLQKAYDAARLGLIINELHRHRLAYWFYKRLSPLLFRNRLITHDGLLSIQKSFTRKELQRLLQQANINSFQIKWHFPFRWSILVLKN